MAFIRQHSLVGTLSGFGKLNWKSLSLAILALVVSANASATVISYNFTTNSDTLVFSYDNTTPTNGQVPYDQGGAGYAGISFIINNVAQASAQIQIFNNFSFNSSIVDIVYFTTNPAGPSIELWGPSTVFSGTDLGQLDNLQLSSFTGRNLNGVNYFFSPNYGYPQNATPLTSLAKVPAPATLALFGLGLVGLGWARRGKV